jgi:hypothetical protein
MFSCPGCGFATATPTLCGDCRRDVDLGDRLGLSRSEAEDVDDPRPYEEDNHS